MDERLKEKTFTKGVEDNQQETENTSYNPNKEQE